MAKNICKVLGIIFLIVGIIGFAAPRFLGMHLTPTHNIIHLVSAALALYFGFAASEAAAITFSRVFGIVYLLLGVAGFAGLNMIGGANVLMLGLADNIVHILLGVVFIIAGFIAVRRPITVRE